LYQHPCAAVLVTSNLLILAAMNVLFPFATELQQPAFLLRCRHQPLRQPGSQDFVLFPRAGHLSSQVVASNGRQQGKTGCKIGFIVLP
jgi:hypothetical protein